MVLNLADSAILPYNLKLLPRYEIYLEYAKFRNFSTVLKMLLLHYREIEKTLDAFKEAGAAKKLAENGATLEHIRVSVGVKKVQI